MLDPDDHDAVDQFIGTQLTNAGVWSSSRESDGVSITRTVSKTPESVHFCGRIYTIDNQTEHNFWIEQHAAPGQVHWTLYFETLAKSERQERNALYALDRADQMEWKVTLRGVEPA